MIIKCLSLSHDNEILRNHLMQSNFFYASPHEFDLHVITNPKHITTDINKYLDLNWNNADYIMIVHHDVFLPQTFFSFLYKSLETLEQIDPNWAVAGPAGVTADFRNVGCVYSSGAKWGNPIVDPVPVRTLDELCIILNDRELRFDENLPNHHFYATDICLQAENKCKSCYAINAICNHFSGGTYDGGYNIAVEYIDNKWKHKKPFATTSRFFV